MITAIREVRRAKGMTLDDVARACSPPTTPQTIGRLEMGTRTVSLPWLNRIAAALGCTPADLVTLPIRETLPVAALLGPRGAVAPRSARSVSPPCATPGMLAVTVSGAVGDYRAGDELWCEPLAPDRFADAMNRDILVPRAAGGYVFARLAGVMPDALHLLPLEPGAAGVTVSAPAWIARVARLVRTL